MTGSNLPKLQDAMNLRDTDTSNITHYQIQVTYSVLGHYLLSFLTTWLLVKYQIAERFKGLFLIAECPGAEVGFV